MADHNYSTTEQKIGKWIDGKDLYEIVISPNSATTGSNVNIDVSSLNIDTVAQLEGYFKRNVSGTKYWIPVGNWELTNYYSWVRIDSENTTLNGNLKYFIHQNYSVDKVFFILQYTKTTD